MANNPIIPLRVNSAARLIAGTTPTIGNLNLARKLESATVLTVLQAITTSDNQYLLDISERIFSARCMRNLFSLFP